MHKVTLARCLRNLYNCVCKLHARLASAVSASAKDVISRKLLGGTTTTSAYAMSQLEIVAREQLVTVFETLELAPNVGQALYNEAFPQSVGGLAWERKVRKHLVGGELAEGSGSVLEGMWALC